LKTICLKINIIHVLVIAGSGIFLVSGDVDDGTSLDWDVCIANGETSADFWSLGVQGNGERSAWECLLCCFGVVYDRLVVLEAV
jgi:hypothetical protein